MFALICAFAAQAERLAIRTFTTADGLGHNAVHRIIQDSRGWLWFATSEGLTRFDGSQFKTYGTGEGLADRRVRDVLVTSEGQYWVATAAGACLLEPKGGKRLFRCLTSNATGTNYVNALIEEKQGVILCGTEGGLLRIVRDAGGAWHTSRSAELANATDARISVLLRHRDRYIWAGGGDGLFRIRDGGTPERMTGLREAGTSAILALTEDRDGRLWVGADGALFRISTKPKLMVEQRFDHSNGLPDDYVQALRCTSDGRLVVGTLHGIAIAPVVSSNGGVAFHSYGVNSGIPTGGVEHLLEDREGNVWLATDGGGAARISRSRLTTFGEADGLSGDPVISIFEDGSGSLSALVRSAHGLLISKLEGGRFITSKLSSGSHIRAFGWGTSQVITRDRTGDWWVATGQGLTRYHKLAALAPDRIYGVHEGLPSENVFRIYEDARGDIWVSTSLQTGNGLARWIRNEDRFKTYSDKDGLRDFRTLLMAAFAEDGAGNLWMGSLLSGLYRYRDGQFRLFGSADGAPTGGIRVMLRDHAGRLWLGSSRNGLVQVENVESERPHFKWITTADGLSSDQVNTLSEDRWGRIYAGTGRGVDRIDTTVRPPKIRHFTSADGLPPIEIEVSHRSSNGDLWFGTARGLVRLTPEPETAEPAPEGTVWILRLSSAGVELPSSEVGERYVGGIQLPADRNQLQVDYSAVGDGEGVRYQYRLQGVDDRWSVPTAVRSVNYAGLSPASYRLEIRAVNSHDAPALVEFRVIPPVWGRWWFRLLALACVAAAAYAAFRYRIAQLLQMERIRTRIATDLHDDIGSSLSHISILGEVARRKLETDGSGARELVEQIAAASRELVDNMGDIVWAINPNRDHLQDLAQRMRHFAGDVFTARGIELVFDASGAEQDRALGAEVRREIFLIFKEAVHNAVRHSGCKRAEVSLAFDSGGLLLTVRDDGGGFALDQTGFGHGLSSMKERALRLHGHLEIHSDSGGTVVTLRVPLRRRGRTD